LGYLRMPECLKSELSSTGFGALLTGIPAENVKFVLSIVESMHPPKVVVVGDFTLRVFLEAGFHPDAGIFDCKTMRSPFLSHLEATDKVVNPSGRITDEAILTIRRIIKRKKPSLLLVDGEEDLLSLPFILNSPTGSLIIYGIPERGMMVITVDQKIKQKVKKLISQFTRVG
jgi:uncharacterized protein (UPF0218 family)